MLHNCYQIYIFLLGDSPNLQHLQNLQGLAALANMVNSPDIQQLGKEVHYINKARLYVKMFVK